MTDDEVRRWLRCHLNNWHAKLNSAARQASLWGNQIDVMLVNVDDDGEACTATFHVEGWHDEFADEVVASTFLGALLKFCNPDRLAVRLDEVALARKSAA